MDRAINLPITGDIHAQLAQVVAVRFPMVLTRSLVGVHKRLHDFADVSLINRARMMQAGNDGSQRKVGGVIHPESPFALTLARRTS